MDQTTNARWIQVAIWSDSTRVSGPKLQIEYLDFKKNDE